MSDVAFVDIDRLTDAQASDLHALYQNEWWTRGRSLEATRTMLLHTAHLFGICERDSGRLVAFARVLTDSTFKAFVFDLIVAPDRRARGLGSRLVRRILEHPDLRSVRHIELACLPELTEFYGRLGFTTDVGDILLMRRQAPRG
jgi:predicted N-acetyltransferase YhbS